MKIIPSTMSGHHFCHLNYCPHRGGCVVARPSCGRRRSEKQVLPYDVTLFCLLTRRIRRIQQQSRLYFSTLAVFSVGSAYCVSSGYFVLRKYVC